MNTCKTCKHWKREQLPTDNVRNTGGMCRSENIRENWSFDYYQPANMVYDYSEGGGFWTGPDFGCVHHSEGQP